MKASGFDNLYKKIREGELCCMVQLQRLQQNSASKCQLSNMTLDFKRYWENWVERVCGDFFFF